MDLTDQAMLHQAAGQYSDAYRLYEHALAVETRDPLRETGKTAVLVYRMAQICQAQAATEDAESLYRRSLVEIEQTMGPNHPDVAHVLNALASLLVGCDRFSEGEELYIRSQTILHSSLKRSWTDRRGDQRWAELCIRWAHALGGLGDLRRRQGRYAEAEPLSHQALLVTERALGPDHPEVAMRLTSLGVLNKYLGNYSDAERFYLRAKGILVAAFGSESPALTTVLYNLAGLQHARGNFDEAEQLAREVLQRCTAFLDPDHPSVAVTMSTLAASLEGHGRLDEAEKLYRHAIRLLQKSHGPADRDVAMNLNNLAALCARRGNPAQAKRLYLRALAIKERVLGSDHPETRTTLNNLAGIYESEVHGCCKTLECGDEPNDDESGRSRADRAVGDRTYTRR